MKHARGTPDVDDEGNATTWSEVAWLLGDERADGAAYGALLDGAGAAIAGRLGTLETESSRLLRPRSRRAHNADALGLVHDYDAGAERPARAPGWSGRHRRPVVDALDHDRDRRHLGGRPAN
jgi:hypothetical protein